MVARRESSSASMDSNSLLDEEDRKCQFDEPYLAIASCLAVPYSCRVGMVKKTTCLIFCSGVMLLSPNEYSSSRERHLDESLSLMDKMSIPLWVRTYGYWRAETEADRLRLMCVFGERLRRSEACNCKTNIIRVVSHKKLEN